MSESILDRPQFAQDIMFLLGVIDDLKLAGMIEGSGHIQMTDSGREQYRLLRERGHTLTDERVHALMGVLNPPPDDE